MAYNDRLSNEPPKPDMSQRIAYFRVSSKDQSVESQRTALGGNFNKEFTDEGVSGATLAAERPGFSALVTYAREGDTLYVYAIDRLGRDAIDVQKTVKGLLDRGVGVHVHGLGMIAKGAGEIILAVLAQVANMEREKIIERTAAGRATARASLATTGKTHKGATSMGRPHTIAPAVIAKWRAEARASIKDTAAHFAISLATVKRACSSGKAPA